MAFQGTQQRGASGLELALKLRQMRSEEKQAKEKLKIDKMKARVANVIAKRKDAVQAQKDAFSLDKSAREREDALRERDASIGPLLDASNDLSLSNPQRQVAANQAIRGINEGISARSPDGVIPQGVPEQVGGTAGAASVLTGREVALASAAEAQKREDAASLPTRKIEHQSDRILELEDQLQNTTDSRKASGIKRKIDKLQSDEFNAAFANLPGEAIRNQANFKKALNLHQSQTQVIEGYESLLKLAETNPRFAGFSGTWTEFGNFLFESMDDFQSIVMGDVQSVLADPESDAEVKEALRDMFLRRDPATGQVISDAAFIENMAKYVIMRSNTPGRMAIKQVEDVGKLTSVTSGTTASAIRRMKSTLKFIKRSNVSTKETLRIMGQSMGLDFDQFGRITLNGRTFRELPQDASVVPTPVRNEPPPPTRPTSPGEVLSPLDLDSLADEAEQFMGGN